jgi:hypothetical protein
MREKLKIKDLIYIKHLIWVYFLFLLFEGAVRKWILPALAEPILIVRDPIALIIIIKAIKIQLLKPNIELMGFIGIGFVSFLSAIIFGHLNLAVAIFGARAMFLHFPLIFIIGLVFNKTDVLEIGKSILILLIPMTVLVIIQFYSPQNSFVNIGVGGDLKGAGFGGALGFFRPPGTFSFINGLSLFYGLAASFVFYFLYENNVLSKWLIYFSTICLIISIPFTISRTVLFQTVLAFTFTFVFILKNKNHFWGIVIFCFVILILFFLIQASKTFGIGVKAFTSRFESASLAEGGLKGTLVDRLFGTLIESVKNAIDEPFWGSGIGSNTNVGFKLLGHKKGSTISDYEWERTFKEIGPFLGIIFIFFRVMLSVNILIKSIKKNRNKEFLSWMLLSFSFLQILQGQISQPTSLGFIVFSGGLTIAAMNTRNILAVKGQ